MDWVSAFAAAAPAIAALIGEAAASGDDAKAEALRQQAMEELGMEVPPLTEFKASAVQSQAAQAHNPAAQSSRLEVLRQLGQRASEGYNDTDRAAINDTLSDVNQRERGQRLAITQGMDPNSGAAIAAQLSNQQAGAQRANQRGVDIAGQSRANAMRALQAQGDLAGDIEQDEFQRGQAQDAISQFNARNSMDAAKFNAQQGQTQFGNRFDLAQLRSGAFKDDADYQTGKGDKKRMMSRKVGQGVQQVMLGTNKVRS